MQVEDWYWQDLEKVGSTNDAAAMLCAAPPAAKFVVSAACQTAGRGRRGRSWQSLAGNLFMSLALPEAAANLNHLPFVLSLALLESIKDLAPDLEVGLKWPNDVLVRGAKISGILLEKTANAYIIAGIGVNIAAAPQGKDFADYPVISLADCNVVTDRLAFLRLYLQRLNADLERLNFLGFEDTRRRWLENACAKGEKIKVNLERRTIEGVFAGIAEDGALVLQQEHESRLVYAGDVFIKRNEENG